MERIILRVFLGDHIANQTDRHMSAVKSIVLATGEREREREQIWDIFLPCW